jgi:hypothetical protein
MRRSQIVSSRRSFRQQVCEGLFPLFGCLCHAFKKDGRALYRPQMTGTIDLPPPGLRRITSQLHDDRIVGWVKFFSHGPLNNDGRLKFQTAATLDGRKLRSPESVVHADQGSGLGCFGAPGTAGRTGNRGECSPTVRAEVHVITFQKRRPARREHPFNATTDRPA